MSRLQSELQREHDRSAQLIEHQASLHRQLEDLHRWGPG